jgi:hypothetical protein
MGLTLLLNRDRLNCDLQEIDPSLPLIKIEGLFNICHRRVTQWIRRSPLFWIKFVDDFSRKLNSFILHLISRFLLRKTFVLEITI